MNRAKMAQKSQLGVPGTALPRVAQTIGVRSLFYRTYAT